MNSINMPIPTYYSEYAGHLGDQSVVVCRNLTTLFRLNVILTIEWEELMIMSWKYTRIYKDTVTYLMVLRYILLVNELGLSRPVGVFIDGAFSTKNQNNRKPSACATHFRLASNGLPAMKGQKHV